MRADDVVAVLDALAAAGVDAWLDGGWGVDALVGAQTRPHADLDLAIDALRLPDAERTLGRLGYERLPPDCAAQPGLPARLVLAGPWGREVDLHPLQFDDHGNGWQQLSPSGRAWGLYEAGELCAHGLVAGRRVRCLTPRLQHRFRLGYELDERGEHDLRLLCERLAAGPLPPPLTLPR